MMTGEAEECFQLPLQEMSYTNSGIGWREGRSKANSNLCKTQKNRLEDIFTQTETFRKLIRNWHIFQINMFF